MYIYGLAPWVGSGTFAEPYTTQLMLSSWVWRATLIDLGLSCWDVTTGRITTDSDHLATMAHAANTQTQILPCGGWRIGRVEVPEYYRDVLATEIGSELPFRGDSLDDFEAHARFEQIAYAESLSVAFPGLDWSDPVIAAVDVIDGLSRTDAESAALWAYYRDILDPSLPTPDGPDPLYDENLKPWGVNLTKVHQVATTSRDLANPIWRAEAAYRCIAYTEAVAAFDATS